MEILTLYQFKRGDVVRVRGGHRFAGTIGFVSSNRANGRYTTGSIVVNPDDLSCIAFFARPVDLVLIGRERLTKRGHGGRTFEREYFDQPS